MITRQPPGLERGFIHNLCTIGDVWSNGFPPHKPRDHTLVEKLAFTFILAGRFCSLSNVGAWFVGSRKQWSNFIDVYLMAWAVVLLLLLWIHPFGTLVTVSIATYQAVMIIANELAVLFVDSQHKMWHQASVSRSILLAMLNFVSLVLCFAILFGAVGNISSTTVEPATLLYFSLVTFTTLGYGEFVPIDTVTRNLVVAELFTAVLFVVAILPTFLGALSTRLNREHPGPKNGNSKS